MKHEGSSLDDLGLDVPPEAEARLREYEDLLRGIALPKGMIAAADVDRIRARHVLDSIRAAPLVPAGRGIVIDLGSGAGLPGIPVAIARPELEVVLTEPRRDRAAFLELAIERLTLPGVRVHAGRAERLEGPADACLARAFRSASAAWAVAEPLLPHGGMLLYWAGSRSQPRVQGVEARPFWTPALADAGPIVMMTRQ